MSEEIMEKDRNKGRAPDRVDVDEILPEYDFSSAEPNKYAPHYAAGGVVVVLDADVAAMFPNAEAANDALRALGGLIQKHQPRRKI